MKQGIPSKITPLWIIASFVSFTEVVLGIAVAQVNGGVQVALTAFVIIFPLLIAGAFFYTLWFRTGVFYPPSEYGDTDPMTYVSAMKGSPAVATQIENAKKLESNPDDKESKFSLIYSMSDKLDWQFLILMHEREKEISKHSSFVYEFGDDSAGTGSLAFGDKFRLEGTGVVEITAGGSEYALTEEGHAFAEWVLSKGKRASFFWTPVGHWGTPKEDGPAAEYLAKRGITLDTDD